jgi:hypothetical protein
MHAPHNYWPTREQVEANLNALFGPPMDNRTGFWVGALLILLLAVGFTVGFVVVAESDVMMKELFLIMLGVAGVGCWYVFGTYLVQMYKDRRLRKLAEDEQYVARVKAAAAKPSTPARKESLPLIPVPSTPPPAPKQKTPEELRAEEIAKVKDRLERNHGEAMATRQGSREAFVRLGEERAALQARLQELNAEGV